MDAINGLKKNLDSVSCTAAAAKSMHEAEVKKKDGVSVCLSVCSRAHCVLACVHEYISVHARRGCVCIRVCVSVCMLACRVCVRMNVRVRVS